MTRNIKGIASGFTPLFDTIAQDPDLGPTAAIVFGRVWRFTQMETGLCTSSQGKMAELTGLSRKTFGRWLKKLIDAGYLVDVTPDDGGTRSYRDTGKVRMIVKVLAEKEGWDLKSQGVGLKVSGGWDLKSHKDTSLRDPSKRQEREIDLLSLTLPSGLHKGRTLQQVSETDPGYVRWVASHWQSDIIRDAARRIVADLGEPGRWTQAELEKARAESLAETPLDAATYLREDA